MIERTRQREGPRDGILPLRRLATSVLLVLAAAALAAGCGGEDAATPDPARDAALIAAAGNGDLREVERLLSDGADVSAVDGTGRTALIAASYGAHVPVARVLMEAGADVNVQDATQQSAYLIATSEVGAGPGLELLRATLAHGADVTTLDSFRGTGLIRAAHRGYGGIVQELIDADIALDHVNRLGWTALLEAIILGDGGPAHTEVVRRLLDAGASPRLADGGGTTPLQHARRGGQEQITALLERAGG